MGGLLPSAKAPKPQVYTPPPAVAARADAAVLPSVANDPVIAEDDARQKAATRRMRGRSSTIATSAVGLSQLGPMNGFTSGYQPGYKVKLGE